MIRILLACEGGTGLGHVGNLKSIAEALGPSFSFDGTHYLDEPLEVLRPFCDAVYRCVATLPTRRPKPEEANDNNWCWANFLANCDFDKPEQIAQSHAWWRIALVQRQIDLVVCDYAPAAILAAKTLGIPVVVTGTAYSVPPDHLSRFPSLMDRDAPTFADEDSMIAAINQVCAIGHMPTIRHLPEIYESTVKLPRGFDFLDPYDGLRTEPLLPWPPDFSPLMAGQGTEIFVYLSNVTADPEFMLDALPELGAPVRAFIPWLGQERAKALADRGVSIETKALHPDDIAQRSRLMVLYGQPGTTALGLASGLPQVAFPQHLEQVIHAQRAAAKGGVRMVRRENLTRDGFVAAVQQAYADEDLLAAARATSPDLRQQTTVDVPHMIRESLRPLLVEIVKKKGLA